MTRIMGGPGRGAGGWGGGGGGGGGKRRELLPWQVLVDSTQTLCQGKLQEVATVRQSLWTLRQLETLLLSRSLFACVRACVCVCVCVCSCLPKLLVTCRLKTPLPIVMSVQLFESCLRCRCGSVTWQRWFDRLWFVGFCCCCYFQCIFFVAFFSTLTVCLSAVCSHHPRVGLNYPAVSRTDHEGAGRSALI